MLYLISQVLLLLALASVISGLIGWLIRAFQSDRNETALKKRLRQSQRSVPSMQRALASAHYEIDRRESDIHRLRRKIAEIDSDPGNFREGDFDNLNGAHPDERAHDLVRERATSGNSQFRGSDFDNGVPVSDAQQRQAVEFLNSRIEDTDGKYRDSDFPDGQPITDTEHAQADRFDEQRSEAPTFYRDGDFEHGAPRNPKEQRYADHIQHLREANKAEKQAAREHRRILVLELDKANAALAEAQDRAASLNGEMGTASDDRVTDLEDALAMAHEIIDKQEQNINDLNAKIRELDNSKENFRAGDLDNLSGRSVDDKARDLYTQRATSGNINFRSVDFLNGQPQTEEQMRQAVEFMHNRDEDTDGKYREGDFENGVPVTPAEKRLSAQIDAMRAEIEKVYRESDFEGNKPSSEEESKLAAKIDVMRAKNKARRKLAKERRRTLVSQLESSQDQITEAQAEIARLQQQSSAGNEAVSDLQRALDDSQKLIENQEKQIEALSSQIKEIDNDPTNFRAGDLDNLNGLTPEQKANILHMARVTSGNTPFRGSDFVNGIPQSEAERLAAVDFLNTRDEDTDGKYREGDFENGVPVTPAEKRISAQIDSMRTEIEKVYRESDFEGNKPSSEEETKLAAQIDVMRAKNKSKRKLAKQRRRGLVKQLQASQSQIADAKAEIERLQQQIDAAPSTETVADLEKALNEANSVIDNRETRIGELETQIEAIDTDPNHFRAGDMDNLDGQSAVERAMELAVARATSGNSQFRGTDFNGRVPLTDEEKKRAIEFLATRDEDTEGKSRASDPVGAMFDIMRAEPEKHYRSDDFEGDKPQSESEIKLAARIDSMREKNKAYRSAAKKQRKRLKQDLANAQEEQRTAKAAAAELESRLQGVANTNDKLEDIIASLKQDLNNQTALQNQAGKKAEDLALEVDKLERELTSTAHAGHRKAGDLESELRRVKDQLNAATQDAELAKQAVSSTEATLADRTSEKEKLEAQIGQYKTDLALANSNLAERKQEVVRLTADKDREIQELQFSLKSQKEHNTRLQQDLDNLKAQLHAAQNDDADRAAREALEIKNAATEARVNELEAALKAESVVKNQTWEELKQELEGLNASLRNKDTDLRDAKGQLADLQDNLSEYEEHEGELRDRIELLESLLAEQRRLTGKSMSSRIREIEAMLSAERRKVESMSIESNISEVSSIASSTPRVVVTSRRFGDKS